MKSLAFPSISTGAFGYPVHEAAEIAVRTIVEVLPPCAHVEHVRFVLFDIATCKTYVRAAENLSRESAAISVIFRKVLHEKKTHRRQLEDVQNPDQTRDFFRDFLPLVHGHDRDEIVVCPTYLCLDAAVHAAKGSNVAIGAQDLYWEKEGAFTGEINAGMLVAVGVTHVIIGHSERRQYFGETDDTVNLKLKSALEAGLIPIVCVGEVLEEREAGLTDDVLRRQCLRAFHKVSAKKAVSLVVAYEPVWAIGTGKTATPQMAADAHASIRAEAAESFGQEFADKLRILYGGSVKPENAHALMSEEEIDGALVGGASLDPKSFAAIVKY
jgi:triosephosphate isomerase (TIM)